MVKKFSIFLYVSVLKNATYLSFINQIHQEKHNHILFDSPSERLVAEPFDIFAASARKGEPLSSNTHR